MFIKILFVILTSKSVFAQINGEFWWLNEKLAKFKGVKPPAPIFENVSEFDTDETDKVVFRDEDLANHDIKNNSISIDNSKIKKNVKWQIHVHFNDESKIVWPSNLSTDSENTIATTTKVPNHIENEKDKSNDDDVFKLHFPDNDLNLFGKEPVKSMNNNDKIKTNGKSSNSENICTYIKKTECLRHKGLIYKEFNGIDLKSSIVCCILPLSVEDELKISFPDTTVRAKKRYRRSKVEDNPALKQRSILLKRKYPTLSNQPKKEQSKIVTSEEEYVDPYWNIKNSNFKRPLSTNKPINIRNNCNQDYNEDYVYEIPKPGLLGVYSDHRGPPGWTLNDEGAYGENGDDVYVDEPSGYSTIDPRRDVVTPKSSKRGKPSKLSSVSDETSNEPESQIINYQSRPDFQVLQGFKLLNLSRNKNKFYSKNSKKASTLESIIEENSEERIIIKTSSEDSNKDGDFLEKQVYNNCGMKARRTIIATGKQSTNTDNVSHPWLALVIRTKKQQEILCYATIVHPRVAITAADCVYGRSPGETTLVTGLWDLNDRSRSQSRVVSTLLPPQYKPNDLEYSLGVLHWTRPLKLGINVQPACLGDPKDGEDCKFFGWGGYDQAISSRSRWQRASILPEGKCNSQLEVGKRGRRLPKNAFCASVQSRGTVTGIGGPLVCDIEGRSTAVGVAVWRDTVLVLMPVLEWPLQAVESVVAK